jgi:hypothetical protein
MSAPQPSATNLARLALAVIMSTAACSGEPTTSRRWAPAERIAGSWQWIQSEDVKTSQVHTPLSTGFQASLTFTAENERSGSFIYARSGAALISGHFDILSEDAPGNDFIAVDPGFDFLTRHAWVTAGGDTLRLGGVYESGFNSTYARIQ